MNFLRFWTDFPDTTNLWVPSYVRLKRFQTRIVHVVLFTIYWTIIEKKNNNNLIAFGVRYDIISYAQLNDPSRTPKQYRQSVKCTFVYCTPCAANRVRARVHLSRRKRRVHQTLDYAPKFDLCTNRTRTTIPREYRNICNSFCSGFVLFWRCRNLRKISLSQ